MLNYRDTLLRVTNHVMASGASVRLEVGRPIDAATLRARAHLDHPEVIPASIRRVFTELGDGVHLNWAAPPPMSCGGVFSVPSAEQLGVGLADWEAIARHGAESASRAEALLDLVPIIEVGNGDSFCVSRGTDGVFFWHLPRRRLVDLALTWDTFVAAWSHRCFQFPESLDWCVVVEHHRVRWESTEFSRTFVLS